MEPGGDVHLAAETEGGQRPDLTSAFQTKSGEGTLIVADASWVPRVFIPVKSNPSSATERTKRPKGWRKLHALGTEPGEVPIPGTSVDTGGRVPGVAAPGRLSAGEARGRRQPLSSVASSCRRSSCVARSTSRECMDGGGG
ncbi:unnamed protein product [Lampetra fluviatilis]